MIGPRDRLDGNRGWRRGRLAWPGVLLVATLSIFSAAAGRPAAASAFLGEMMVEAAGGTARVAGTGNSFGVCSTGQPTTAAAGKRNGKVTVTVRPASCTDQGAVGGAHRLPAGIYEVRYTAGATYTLEGDRWVRAPGPQGHCFAAESFEATRVLGTFSVDADGVGTWTGRLTPNSGGSAAAISGSDEPGRASNLCIGTQKPGLRPDYPTTGGPPGLQVPFRLLPGDGGSTGLARNKLVLLAAGAAGVAGVLAFARRRRRT